VASSNLTREPKPESGFKTIMTGLVNEVDEKLTSLYVEPAGEIDESNTFIDPETQQYQFEARAAVKLVLDDTESADTYLNILQWASGWTLADLLYQSPQATSAFDGGNVAQANVPKFILSNHISSIVPKLMGGIFYEDPPFLLRPLPGTTQEVVRAKTALFSHQLWDMKFEEEAERMLDQMALLGTGIMKWGYAEYTKKIKKRKQKSPPATLATPVGPKEIDTVDSDDFDVVLEDKLVSRPWIKYCDIRTVLVDTGCRYGDIRRAGWVVYRDYVTFDDLSHWRGQEGYKIPEEDVLRHMFFQQQITGAGVDNITMTIPEAMWGYIQHAIPRNIKSTSDPMKAPMEVLERWDNDRVIVVLSCAGHNILIRNEANPYGVIPFLSANWRNIPDCFYGQGLGILIGSEQMVDQGVTNLALDLLAYGLQPTALRKKGFNAPTQALRWKQGGIIDVDDDVDKAFKFLTMPPVPSEAWMFINQSKSDAASSSGANEQVVQGAGSPGIHTTGMRSGTGAAAVIQANASRLDGPDGRFIRQVFEPWLYRMDDLNNDYLPTKVLREILDEELSTAYKLDHIQFRNARLEYEVLAGAHLGAKKEMAQALPFVLQLMNNPTFVQNVTDGGKMFDGIAIFKAFTDAAGWKFSQDFLRDMTPEEKQKYDANTPSALQARQLRAQQQMQLQKFQQEQQLEDQRAMGKGANEVLRQATEKALTPEEVEGVPGNTGFGDTTIG
jgi:hypothetical protein